MVCVKDSRNDNRVVTRFLRPRELIQTGRGTVPAVVWLQRERDRLEQGGIACEIVQSQGGRIAVRKQ